MRSGSAQNSKPSLLKGPLFLRRSWSNAMTRAVNQLSHAANKIEQTGKTVTTPRPQAPASDAHGPHSADRKRLVEGTITPTLVRFAMPLLTTNLLNALSGT